MPDNELKAKSLITIPDITEALNLDDLHRLLNSYTYSTGLGAVFLSADRKMMIKPDQYAQTCTFCNTVQGCTKGNERCRDFMHKAGQQAAELGETYITRCHAGLVELFAPIMFRNIYIGCIACGPVLMWELDDMARQEIVTRTADLNLSSHDLLSQCEKIRIYSGKSVQASADLLFMAVNYLAQAGVSTLEHRKELTSQQARIAELVFEKKQAEETITALEHAGSQSYPLHKEKELLGRVRLGDRTGAREILNDILGEIFFRNSGNLDVIKARVLELVVMLSRAAVEGGAQLDKMLGLNYELVTGILYFISFDDLCMKLKDTLDTMLDNVYVTRNVKNAETLSQVLHYIRENYSQPITLDEVARSVFLSPFYFSHMFMDELGITFMEYLTRVRMEEAKKLLGDKSLSMQSIAESVGYDDASYFSKVFKKNVGVTPNKYRTHLP
jgi:two-component system, response regulator YesN